MLPTHEKHRKLKSLKKREMEVVFWQIRGLKDPDIAQKLGGITVKTVADRRTGVYDKLEIKNIKDNEKPEALIREYSQLVNELVPDEEALKNWTPTTEDPPPTPDPTSTRVNKPSRRRPWVTPLILGGLLVGILCLGSVYGLNRMGYIGFNPPLNHSPTSPLPTPEIPSATVPVVVPISSETETAPETQAETPQPQIPPTEVNPSATNPPPTSSSVLFFDNFSSGLDPAWVTLSGQPQIVQGALTTSEETWLQLSNPSWDNVKITITIKANNCWFNDSNAGNVIGVGESPNNMVSFAWVGCQSVWRIINSGAAQEVANSEADGTNYDKATLTLTFKDNSYTASAPDLFETNIILPDKSSTANNIFFKLERDSQVYLFKVEEIP